MSAPGKRRSWRRKLLFSCVPLLVLMLLGEIGARVWRGMHGLTPFGTSNYRAVRVDFMRRGYPAQHDERLGFVPRAGFRSSDNQWGVLVSIDERSLRNNGTPWPQGPGVLAVGDSFTFGDQVGDADTWPSRLQEAIDKPVWNGGVFAYSFAQSVLRAEQLLPTLPVETLLVSLIPDDLRRCEFGRSILEIPWYQLVDGELVLQNVPVPDPAESPLARQHVRHLLGYSALLDAIFAKAVPQWWVGHDRGPAPHARGVGVQIGTRLLERLAATCRERGVRLLLVLQSVEHPEEWELVESAQLLAAAETLGVQCLDLQAEFARMAAADPSLFERFYDLHMTAAGNAWVAERIAAELQKGR
ncbi:MAG: hypothetical protein R3F29_01875 [Planctomycetota bacterium]